MFGSAKDNAAATVSLIRLRVPHGSIVRPYARRGFVLWLIVRLGIALIPLLAGNAAIEDVVRWTVPGALGVLAMCVLVGHLDVRVRGERVLLGNLGIADREIIAMYLAPAIPSELLLALILPW